MVDYKKLGVFLVLGLLMFSPVYADQILKNVTKTCTTNTTLQTTYDVRNQTNGTWDNESRVFVETCQYGCTGNTCDQSPIVNTLTFICLTVGGIFVLSFILKRIR